MKQSNLEIIKNEDKSPLRHRLLIGTPTLGIIRAEWAVARFGAISPCNWSITSLNVPYNSIFPLGYRVAEAQNVIVDVAVKQGFEWVLLHEDDVILPPEAFIKFNYYMNTAKIPVVSGLYFLKNSTNEPLVYRGRGNSSFMDFKVGERVWADGVPTGCLLIHSSVLKLMWEESPEYTTGLGQKVRKVFETPANVWTDPEGNKKAALGTSDLFWCDRVMKEKVFERSGWKKHTKKNPKYPFLCDTSIFCKHIDLQSGTQYPLGVK